jgi:hypothetical protein
MSDEKKLTFEEWKVLFNSTVEGVTVGWDSGHCYTIIKGDVPDCELCEDEDEAYDYSSEYESECGPTLYCVPPIINDLVGHHACVECTSCHWDTAVDEDRIEWVKGFIALVEKESPDSTEWYKLEFLKRWVLIETTKKILRS